MISQKGIKKIIARNILLTCGVLFIVLLVLPLIGFAANNYNVTITPIKNHIDVGGVAKYSITINNLGNSSIKFNANSFLPLWNVFISPRNIMTNGVTVPAHEQYSFYVNLIPTSAINENSIYSLSLTLANNQGTPSKKLTFLVYYSLKTDEYTYSPLIYISSKIVPPNIDPRKKFRVSITLMNQNPLNYSNLSMIFLSKNTFGNNGSYHLINTEKTASLDPRESKTYDFIFQIENPKQLPENDSLSVFLQYDNQIIAKATDISFQIIGYKDMKESSSQKNSSFPVYSWEYNYYNNGTLNDTRNVDFSVTWYNRIFTSSNIKPTYSYNMNGKTFLAWNLNIGPNQSEELTITQNYWSLIIMIMVILGLIILYYVIRSPVVLTKKVGSLNTNNGGITDMKIMINIKNRTNKKIKKVSIIEFIPSIAGVDTNFEIGSLKPTKILTNNKKGTILKWNFEELNPLDERIITYNFKPKLTLVGDFTLPPTLIKFSSKGGTRSVNSNSLSVKA